MESLSLPPLDRQDWLSRIGGDNVRLVRDGDRVAGGLSLLPLGMWLGGAQVAMTGVTHVVVAPERRGLGYGRTLIEGAVRELHAGGVGLAVLHPSTQRPYRAAGFEQAGALVRYRARAAALAALDRDLSVARVGPEGHALLREQHRTRARATNGNLERSAWAWHRILELGAPAVFAVEGGYTVVGHRPVEGAPTLQDVHLRDLVALTPAAGRRLFTLLADLRSTVRYIEWNGGPVEPLLALLAEQPETLRASRWMARVCEVAAALGSRGYRPGAAVRLELELDDELVPANSGRWTLAVTDGRATVTRGGEGRLRMPIRGLAPLVTGWLTPSELAGVGLLDAPPSDLAAATALFAGPTPWMSDRF